MFNMILLIIQLKKYSEASIENISVDGPISLSVTLTIAISETS